MDNNRGRTSNTVKMQQPPPISKETQQLLKLMMEESKLTNFQQRQLSSRAKSGGSLPLRCNPTSSKEHKSLSPSKPMPKVLNGRHFSGGSGKRPKEVIDVLTENSVDQGYRPQPSRRVITEKDKAKLQNKMAFGDDLEGMVSTRNTKSTCERLDDDVLEQYDEFEECLQQIEERRNFLSEMEELGQGNKYRTMIQTEISQKIRELELIDKQRTVELEKALQDRKSIH